jgi:hypothetical protein
MNLATSTKSNISPSRKIVLVLQSSRSPYTTLVPPSKEGGTFRARADEVEAPIRGDLAGSDRGEGP